MIDFLERLVPLLVALLTAITPVVVAIISNGKKSRKQHRSQGNRQHCDRIPCAAGTEALV